MAKIRASTAVTLAILGAGAGAVLLSMQPSRPHSLYPADLAAAEAAAIAADEAADAAASDDDWLRNTYDSREQCIADYSEEECREERVGSGGSGGGFFYFGPWYRGPSYIPAAGAPPNPGPGRTAVAAGLSQPATRVERFRPGGNAGSQAAASRSQRGGFGASSNYYGSRVS